MFRNKERREHTAPAYEHAHRAGDLIEVMLSALPASLHLTRLSAPLSFEFLQLIVRL
jgi:hypothetical protein